MFKPKIIGYI